MPDKYVMYAFIRGLKKESRDHVWGSRSVKSTDEAEKVALRFAASMKKGEAIGKAEQHGRPPKTQSENKRNNGADGRPRGAKDTKRQKAFDDFKLKKNNCFACGLGGHRRPECKASETEKTKHQTYMANLKAIMYPNSQ
jgi:hypothetical protein